MQLPFTTPLEDTGELLIGPPRSPRQMLATQQYDNHSSIHDDSTARQLGFKGGTIEGPTHFSQFVPLCVAAWGVRWFEQGCLSAHYRNPCFEGEQVRAYMAKPQDGARQVAIWMQRADGTEILRGTAAIGTDLPPSALEQRLTELRPPEAPVILRDVSVGMRTPRLRVQMTARQPMGALYPFSLADKLQLITESSPWYTEQGAAGSPWGRPLIPFEMVSVLLNYCRDAEPFPARGPVVALFADQEIRMLAGPLFVGEVYEIDREVVGLSGSRRTESMWIRTRVFQAGSDRLLATMLLNSASLKESYAHYDAEQAALYAAQ